MEGFVIRIVLQRPFLAQRPLESGKLLLSQSQNMSPGRPRALMASIPDGDVAQKINIFHSYWNRK